MRIIAAGSGVDPSYMHIDSVLRRDQSCKNQLFEDHSVENQSTEENQHNGCLVKARFIQNLAFHEPELRDYRALSVMIFHAQPSSPLVER